MLSLLKCIYLQHLHGKVALHPFCNRKLKIVCDDSVDPEFGTGKALEKLPVSIKLKDEAKESIYCSVKAVLHEQLTPFPFSDNT